MKWLSVALALAAPSEAYLRFGCGTVSIQRIDPIVEPGKVPSSHVHQIVGGNAFNATMDPLSNVAERATCTTCQFTEDLSNYWTGQFYVFLFDVGLGEQVMGLLLRVLLP